MKLALLAALLLLIAAACLAFGWFVRQNEPHAVGLIALALALQLLEGVVPDRPGK